MNEQDFDAAFSGTEDETPTTDVTETVEQTVEEVSEETVEQTEEAEANYELTEQEVKAEGRLNALLDTRDKLREEKRLREERERELQELRDQMARQQAPQQNQSFPDPYDDPQGFADYMQQQTYQAVMMERWNNSTALAIAAHGQETVDAARLWAGEHAKTNPAFEQEAMAQAHPLEWVVQQHTRHARLREFETDEEAFVRRRAAEMGLIPHSPMAAAPLAQSTPTAPKAAPPVSLATVSSQSKPASKQAGKDAFDAVFNTKR